MHLLLIGHGRMGQRWESIVRTLDPLGRLTIYDPVRYPTSTRVLADAVIIASPAPCHAEAIAWCCRQERPLPFLVEKPLGLQTLPARRHPQCAVGFNYRFHPQWEAIVRLAQRQWLSFIADEQLVERYGNTVAQTSASHAFDMALQCLGPLRAQTPRLWTDGVRLTGSLRHVRGTSTYTYDSDAGRKQVTISNGQETIPLLRDETCYTAQVRSWLDWIATGRRDPRLATVEDGLMVEQILEKVCYDEPRFMDAGYFYQ